MRSGAQRPYSSRSTSASWNSTLPRPAAAARVRAPRMAVEPDDAAGDPRQREREPPRAAAEVEHALAGQLLLGQQREEPGADAGSVLRRRHSGAPSSALKYLASGWWKTRADTEASGSIMKPSVRPRPICSGRSRSNSARWSARLGQAG